MNFKHTIHNQVLRVLHCLDSGFLASCRAYFGGGTMLALNYGEYRLSKDIDFLCPYGAEFSQLRRAIYDRGYAALFLPSWEEQLQLPGSIKTDRDGVRFGIQVDRTILKFKIVAEGRIGLDSPSMPHWSPVPCLSVVDQVAEKLLANGDRWEDTSVDSRDLIDLAVLKQHTDFSQAAIDKAESAYRSIDPLKRSIVQFQANPEYRSRCYERLQVSSPVEIANGLDQLAQRFGLDPMVRQTIETVQEQK
ncbi:hypothetical protein LEP3755_14350 [Leptolyngbya sp. NIES-3755]|nr:hypothetical protein LEP3755_14350 [Leptolyngbya sp. NIES-3755]